MGRDQVDPTTVTWKRDLNRPNGKTTQVNAASIKQIANHYNSLIQNGEKITLPVLRYFGAGRLWETVKDTSKSQKKKYIGKKEAIAEERWLESLRSPLFGYKLSVDKRCSPLELLRWMRDERRFEIDEEHPSKFLHVVLTAIRSFMPELSNVSFNLRLDDLLLEYTDGRRVTFRDLSDGYRNVVAIVADIAIKMVMLNPHLDDETLSRTPGVVLIDELDLHLHPKWQRRIVEDLRRTFPLVQFICTTHSPFIVQSLRSGEELIVLDGQPTLAVANLTLEEVAEGLMGVNETDVSARYTEMKNTARSLLEEMAKRKPLAGEALKEFEQRLAIQSAPYADNPAFQAFLEMKLASKRM